MIELNGGGATPGRVVQPRRRWPAMLVEEGEPLGLAASPAEQARRADAVTRELESILAAGMACDAWRRAPIPPEVVEEDRGFVAGAVDFVVDQVQAGWAFVEGLFDDDDELALDGDAIGDGEGQVRPETVCAMMGEPLGAVERMLGVGAILGTTALVPFAAKPLAIAGATALVVPGAKALVGVGARSLALRLAGSGLPAVLTTMAAHHGPKAVLASVLKTLMALLTAKEVYDILSDLFPGLFPPLGGGRQGPKVAIYERGRLKMFARGPVWNAPGTRAPSGQYVRYAMDIGVRVRIIR